MLVLNRKTGESIMIGDDMEIKILDMGDGVVKIGIEAPKERTILRKEIYDQVVVENKKAMAEDGADFLQVLKARTMGSE